MNEDAGTQAVGQDQGGSVPPERRPAEPVTVQPMRRGEQVVLAGEAFRVWLRLDLGDALRRGAALDYVATVSARRLREGPRQVLGESRGRLASDGDSSVAVEVPSVGLPAGTYRVEAAVALLDPATAQPLGLGAFMEGVVLHAVPTAG
ncbi:MAG TPA: hypothetical protein VNK73_13195 [Actinomycetota bacterium]|jgi:hypothetical protein|nr:hypothetical protein [Actinomycetota bacterium]